MQKIEGPLLDQSSFKSPKANMEKAYHGTDMNGRPACFVPAPTERHLRNRTSDALLDQAIEMESASNSYGGETSTGMKRRAGQILDHAIQLEEKWSKGEISFD